MRRKITVYRPSVVSVVFVSGHESIKNVLVTLGLESFEDEDDRRQVNSLVIGERQVGGSVAQVVQHDCLTHNRTVRGNRQERKT